MRQWQQLLILRNIVMVPVEGGNPQGAIQILYFNASQMQSSLLKEDQIKRKNMLIVN